MLGTIKKYATIVGVIALIALFGLWRVAANNYESEKAAREQAEVQLVASQKEVENLTRYNKELAKQNAEIEKEYAEIYKNIPADACGDAKPSADLLNYLSQGAQ